MASIVTAMILGYQQSNSEQQKTSLLLSLPGELRNKIYSYVVVSSAPILLRLEDRTRGKPLRILRREVKTLPKSYAEALRRGDSTKVPEYYVEDKEEGDRVSLRFKLSPGHPALLFASKQIREEARSIYYRENVFAFTEHALSSRAIQAFRRMAGTNNLNMASLRVFRDFPVPGGPMQVSFKLTWSGDRIDIEIGKVNHPYRADYLLPAQLQSAERKDMVCTCRLLGLAQTHSQALSNCHLLDFLDAYAGTIKQVYAGYIQPRHSDASICAHCGKLECI